MKRKNIVPLSLEVGSNVTWVNVGGAVTLRCVATSYPRATVSWSRAEVHSRSQVLDHVRVLAELTISAVRRVDNGTYACMASNQRDMMVAAQDVVVLAIRVLQKSNKIQKEKKFSDSDTSSKEALLQEIYHRNIQVPENLTLQDFLDMKRTFFVRKEYQTIRQIIEF